MKPASKRVEYQADPNKFDLQVHAWDGQGKMIKANHYRQHIIGATTYYERPVNSGNLWFENNQPAGRMEYTFGEDGKIASKELHKGAPHKDWTRPLSGTEKVHFELEQQKAKNAQLEAEIAAIKAEKEAAGTAKEPVKNMAPQASGSPTLTKRS